LYCFISSLEYNMLIVHVTDVEAVYECQPLLAPPVDFPPPGGLSLLEQTAEEDIDDAS
jgi:hypothetical protein